MIRVILENAEITIYYQQSLVSVLPYAIGSCCLVEIAVFWKYRWKRLESLSSSINYYLVEPRPYILGKVIRPFIGMLTKIPWRHLGADPISSLSKPLKMTHLQQAMREILKLRASGFRIWIQDLGTLEVPKIYTFWKLDSRALTFSFWLFALGHLLFVNKEEKAPTLRRPPRANQRWAAPPPLDADWIWPWTTADSSRLTAQWTDVVIDDWWMLCQHACLWRLQ